MISLNECPVRKSDMKLNEACGIQTIEFQQKYDGLEIKSGDMWMVQICNDWVRKIPVFVRVYKTLFEHYAIVYKNENISTSAVYVSLKHSQVHKGDGKDIMIIPDNVEGTNLTLEVTTHVEVDDWVSALTPTVVCEISSQSFTPPSSPLIPKSPTMPPLPEVDEG